MSAMSDPPRASPVSGHDLAGTVIDTGAQCNRQGSRQAKPGDADFWFTLAGDAALAELRQDPIPLVKQEDVNEAVSRIEATLAPQEVLKFASALQSPRTVSPPDACWAMRILYREGTALVEPYRAAIARATAPH